jgi:cysteine sulfinate desulfinase/cysteine desulfurase-like protein
VEGGQEKGLRSGTLPVPLCVALGKAAELAEELREFSVDGLLPARHLCAPFHSVGDNFAFARHLCSSLHFAGDNFALCTTPLFGPPSLLCATLRW